ncbi:endo-1,4-beta-xylanase [Mucilaginibacter celer]|uniref:Beta-xylanase n=1 Tax=Mucilaginibacter celer TaxID=2305508 RepID=A0A494VN15_9SPHI|nr:endo-1,4-beta-xylanase [Mucilaginibacter celer]AYL95091.1 endo-1,4-beta-xylanase [Mucilaginibacter celer]
MRLNTFKLSVLPLLLAIPVTFGSFTDRKPLHPKIKKDRVTNSLYKPDKGLKGYYRKYFPIGVAVNTAALSGPEAELIVKEFNSVTPENDMKMGPIHPQENEYNWKNADAIVAFAQQHHIKIRGHNLLWHAQAPAWMFKDSTGKQVSKEVLLKRLKDHITAVVTHFKGKIYAWDVVNEAIDDKPDLYLRNTLWYQICGEDFIAKAFEYAHEADPDAQLFYNDYNSEVPSKRDKICKLIRSLKDAGVPVTGIGLQGHWKLNEPSVGQITEAIDKYAALGLKLQITELDITVRTAPSYKTANQTPPDSTYTESMAAQQAERYKAVFEIFRKYKKVITGVTFWNVSDKHSWLDYRGGGIAGGAAASQATSRKVTKAYPLLFDENLQRKKAYWDVVNF